MLRGGLGVVSGSKDKIRVVILNDKVRPIGNVKTESVEVIAVVYVKRERSRGRGKIADGSDGLCICHGRSAKKADLVYSEARNTHRNLPTRGHSEAHSRFEYPPH